jgi:8-oxo-dGTP diphosphatase
MTRPVSHAEWAARFPRLSATVHGPDGEFDATFSLESPPDRLVSNVHVVGRTNGGIVVCRNDLGWRFLPGGTREPGENIDQTVRRELSGEAGARLLGPLRWIGAHRCVRHRSEPVRPHLPHPVTYFLYAAADVALDGAPTNPPGDEQVVEVLVLPPTEAVDWLAEFDPPLAELVALTIATLDQSAL